MNWKHIWLALILLTGLPLSAQDDAADPTVVVTWTAGGDLFYWDSESAQTRTLVTGEGEAGWAFISPSGERVAYLRLGDDGENSVWAVDASGDNRREIASGDVWNQNWLDDETLFYSTMELVPGLGLNLNNDLLRVNVMTGETETMPVGGMLVLNPSRTGAAIVQPGAYEQEPGAIWYMPLDDPDASIKLREFEAVASGAHTGYFPMPRWLDDETIIFALPQPDAVEHPQDAISEIWQVAVDGAAEQLGTIPGGLYTWPDWSPDGSQMVYSYTGPLDDPQIDASSTAILIANHDGSDLHVVAEYPAFATEVWNPRWLDDMQFTFVHDNAYWRMQPDSEPQRWLEGAGTLFFDDGVMVYLAPTDEALVYDLRYARVGDDSYTQIATLSDFGMVSVTIPAR